MAGIPSRPVHAYRESEGASLSPYNRAAGRGAGSVGYARRHALRLHCPQRHSSLTSGCAGLQLSLVQHLAHSRPTAGSSQPFQRPSLPRDGCPLRRPVITGCGKCVFVWRKVVLGKGSAGPTKVRGTCTGRMAQGRARISRQLGALSAASSELKCRVRVAF